MADSKPICSVPGCGNDSYVRGWCNAHYLRWRRHGDPLGGGVSKGEPLRWARRLVANPPQECVEWPFASNGNGYGWAWFDGKRIGAHRMTLSLFTGRNPQGMEACHGPCHNRLCVNPLHLSWKVRAENSLDRHRDQSVKTKLTLEQAREIKKSKEHRPALAARYGVDITMVHRIQKGKAWKHA